MAWRRAQIERFNVPVLLGTAVLGVAMTGCSDVAAENTPSPPTPAATGSVAGSFRITGGPYPGVDEPLSGSVTFAGQVTERVIAPDGTFALELPPGTYAVTGQPQDGRLAPNTCLPETVTVLAEQLITVEVSCVFE